MELNLDTSNAKGQCLVCGGKIKNPIANYLINGNTCPTCSRKAEVKWHEDIRSQKKIQNNQYTKYDGN